MKTMNRAIEDAADFRGMMDRLEKRGELQARKPQSPEIEAWNAEVERKRAEKLARKLTSKVRA